MRIAAVLLFLVLSWDPPTTNCDGTPLLDLDHYELPIMRVSILGWIACTLPDGTGALCPSYAWTFARERTQGPTITLADPGVGEVLGYEWPEAFDLGGLSSADPCQGGA